MPPRESKREKRPRLSSSPPPRNRKRQKLGKITSSQRPGPPLGLGPQAELALKPSNNLSICSLPVELILHVISFIPGLPVPFRDYESIPHDYASRLETLISMSQTCQWLRNTVSPYVWRSFEVYIPIKIGARPFGRSKQGRTKKWQKTIATELVRQAEITTIRDPSRAQFVE